jgi:hypothetical protein
MKRLKPLLLLASVLTLHLVAGCANPCLNLADQICSCQPDDVTRSACQQRAREQEAIFPVNSQDQQRCQQALDTHVCDCQRILTPEGRVACRLAYAPDAGTPDAGAFAPLDAPLP